MRGDTDRATASELLAPAVAQLIVRAERSTGMVEVQTLLAQLRALPGVRSPARRLRRRSPIAAGRRRCQLSGRPG